MVHQHRWEENNYCIVQSTATRGSLKLQSKLKRVHLVSAIFMQTNNDMIIGNVENVHCVSLNRLRHLE